MLLPESTVQNPLFLIGSGACMSLDPLSLVSVSVMYSNSRTPTSAAGSSESLPWDYSQGWGSVHLLNLTLVCFLENDFRNP